MSRKNRKLKNILVTPRFQMKVILYYISSGLVIIGVMVAMIYERLTLVRSLMSSGELMTFETQTQITDIMFQVVQYSVFGLLGFVLFSFTFALIISHRIAGPVVAICAFIEELKKGNYDYGRKLRPRDELNEIMDKLHELASILKESKPQQSE